MDLLHQIIELAIEQAREDRTAVNLDGGPGIDIEVKRAVAQTVTKLEEALMWKEKAFDYYDKR